MKKTGLFLLLAMGLLSLIISPAFADRTIVSIKRISEIKCRAVFTCTPYEHFDKAENGEDCLGDVQYCFNFESISHLRDMVPPSRKQFEIRLLRQAHNVRKKQDDCNAKAKALNTNKTKNKLAQTKKCIEIDDELTEVCNQIDAFITKVPSE